MKKVLCLAAAFCILGSGTVSAAQEDTYLPEEIQQLCIEAGEEYNICPELIMSIVEHESSGDPEAVSSAGCVGLM